MSNRSASSACRLGRIKKRRRYVLAFCDGIGDRRVLRASARSGFVHVCGLYVNARERSAVDRRWLKKETGR